MPATAEKRLLGKENGRLRARLEELEETLRAIRSGEVDALVVETAGEDQVFTLKSADQTYRLMVEQMQKGAATLSDESGVSRAEVSFRRAGGAVRTQVSLTLLPLEGARVFSMIVTDLTERKRGEEERAQLAREQLARAAAEEAHRAAQEEIGRRTRIEESLRQAEKQRSELLERAQQARAEAEEANRLKDEFLATLSHELRSPLNAIVAWSHILCQPGLDADTAGRAAQAIDRNARAQAQLVADILDVSRIITGKFRMSSSPVRLQDVIESAADAVRPAA
jgi:signal transduction histidine kinase